MISRDQIKAALEAYNADHPGDFAEAVDGDKKFRWMPDGTPGDKDVQIWELNGKLKCSNTDFGMEFMSYLPQEPAKPRQPEVIPNKKATPNISVEKSQVKPVATPPGNLGEFRKAERRKAKLRLGITGPAGSGKTMSALLIAGGLVDGDYSKVGILDTENGSADLYVNSDASGSHIGEYNVLTLTPPFEAQKYINGIKMAEESGLEVVILDSITHAWAGEGGFLEKQGRIADKSGNSWSAWRSVTPEHNRFIDAMLQSKIHVIATMRSKTEHVYEGGKVKKLGMAPVAREGMEYEFSVVFDMDQAHNATPTKDRTSLFDGKIFKPSTETGKTLLKWLEVKS